MAGCKSVSSFYLKTLNIFVLLCSLCIIGYSSYLISQANDVNLQDTFESSPFVIPLVVGVCLFLVSLLGLFAVYKDKKFLLFVYLVLAVIITLFVLACGVVLVVYSNLLNDIQNSAASAAVNSTAAVSIKASIVDFELAVYTVCCSQAFASAIPVVSCSVSTSDICISNQERFDSIVAKVPDRVCSALAQIDINGAPIVGDPAVDGGCGDGTGEQFADQFSSYLSDNIRPIGAANISLSVLLLLALLATCVLLCTKKEGKKGENLPQAQVVNEKDKAGPELAYGH